MCCGVVGVSEVVIGGDVVWFGSKVFLLVRGLINFGSFLNCE